MIVCWETNSGVTCLFTHVSRATFYLVYFQKVLFPVSLALLVMSTKVLSWKESKEVDSSSSFVSIFLRDSANLYLCYMPHTLK